MRRITAQQTCVAVPEERLQAAGRVVTRGSPAVGAAAHRRADQALLALEAAERTLEELIAAHTAATSPGAAANRRGLRAVPAAGQDALFDVS